MWKLLTDECFQCIKEPTNEVEKNAFAVLYSYSYDKEDVFPICNKNPHDCIHVFIPVLLHFGHDCN